MAYSCKSILDPMEHIRLLLYHDDNDRVESDFTMAGDGMVMQVGDDFSQTDWIHLAVQS